MSDQFFSQPILNSPYERPSRHWELDETGQPTQAIIEKRRLASFVSPIPKAKRQRTLPGEAQQDRLLLDEGLGLSTAEQQYELTSAFINEVREHVERWRAIPDPSKWRVTPVTARLLQHWRSHQFNQYRPFFCQVEAVETAIWLTEVAPQLGSTEKNYLERLESASQEANPGLSRLALKLATGAGKTTVMAMLIAWQTLNAVRQPTSPRFTKGFVIVTPGITIKDRLRVLLPSSPDAYYKERELVPEDMLLDIGKARIVITNYHAFKLRETFDVSKGGRQLLQGRTDEPISTLETDGQMIKRVMPELMNLKNIVVINDEAHHCYRERPEAENEDLGLKGDDKAEVEENNEAARLWISGIEAIDRKLGVKRVLDLSATPFFLRGSGYAEGTLFPWTMSDFSLMDAIECGIVKLPRVPIADNISGSEMPMYRNLWEHIGKSMPKKGRGRKNLDPHKLPAPLYTALEALYGHYERTYEEWRKAKTEVPPCFIIVCNNTTTSKAVYDYIAGFERELEDGTVQQVDGRLRLFQNHDDYGNPLARPNTILIDSKQLESGEGLDSSFREAAADELERFRRERIERAGGVDAGEVSEDELLREVMNTVGKPGQLGASVRCVVSVSMLTEGWDANTVTHVLGLRAFGTQLLCEQVVGRALRRLSYDLNEAGLFEVEYADVLGIPFDFTAKPVVSTPQPPRPVVQVRAVRPERNDLEIRFPRIQGYRAELPNDLLEAEFNEDSRFVLTPHEVGATHTKNAGIIGEQVDLNLIHTGEMRKSSLTMHITKHVLERWREPGEPPRVHLYGRLNPIVRKWLDEYLDCQGGTYPAQLMYRTLADHAVDRIIAGIVRTPAGQKHVVAIPDPFNPEGSTMHVNFTTSKADRWQTDVGKSHVNFAVLDSDWEGEFCRVVEQHQRTISYVKNQGLGFEVPYLFAGQRRTYIPDFIVQLDDGLGHNDPLNLVVEIKGYRGEDAKDKRATMLGQWVPGVNRLGEYGRWGFVELADRWQIEEDYGKAVNTAVQAAKQGSVQTAVLLPNGARQDSEKGAQA